MKVFEIRDGFGLDNLVGTERTDPEPGPGQVVIEVSAVSLNYRDLLMVNGLYNPRQPLPLVPTSDGVGQVVELGHGVDELAEGDRVAPIFCQKWLAGAPTRARLRATLGGPLDGMLAERVVMPAESVVRVPEHLSDIEAATLPCAALTAWSALVTHGPIKAGDTVLLLGTGGVSIFALQFAKMMGAHVIITSSSDDKLERAESLGADATINYRRTEDWGKAARKLAGGEGVDRVVEVGGAKTLTQSLRAVRIGGTIALIGTLSGRREPIDLARILMSEVRVQGVLVGHREGFEAMNRAIAQNELHPVVDAVFPFDHTPDAFRHLAGGGHFGKIAVNIPG
jgi:NADPH:quinone reductase-like Zn-dependent oxidoreductase